MLINSKNELEIGKIVFLEERDGVWNVTLFPRSTIGRVVRRVSSGVFEIETSFKPSLTPVSGVANEGSQAIICSLNIGASARLKT